MRKGGKQTPRNSGLPRKDPGPLSGNQPGGAPGTRGRSQLAAATSASSPRRQQSLVHARRTPPTPRRPDAPDAAGSARAGDQLPSGPAPSRPGSRPRPPAPPGNRGATPSRAGRRRRAAPRRPNKGARGGPGPAPAPPHLNPLPHCSPPPPFPGGRPRPFSEPRGPRAAVGGRCTGCGEREGAESLRPRLRGERDRVRATSFSGPLSRSSPRNPCGVTHPAGSPTLRVAP